MIKKILVAVIGLLVLGGITFAFYKLVFLKSPRFNKAGLKVETYESGAKVYVDNTLAGETPFSTQNLKSGEITLSVDGKYGRFEDKITLGKNTFSLVNLKIAPVTDFTSSQVLWMEKQSGGQSLSVLSNVLGVRVNVDGEDKGLSPLTVDGITSGDHKVELIKDGYETVVATVNVLKDHKVNFKVALSPAILPPTTESIEYSTSDLVSIQNYAFDKLPRFLFSNPQSWARGLAFIKETQSDLKIKFDYLLDYNGNIYDTQGFQLDPTKEAERKEGFKVAYLGDSEESKLTTAAQKALDSFVALVLGEGVKQIQIIETGTGFLRVRSTPSLNGEEIGKVDVGDKFRIIEEQGGWYKIEYATGKEGWVLGDYTKEVENE